MKHSRRILRQDAQIAERAVSRLINVPLTDGQFDALVSFTYNLGGGALQRSTLAAVKSTVRNTPKYQNNLCAGSGLEEKTARAGAAARG